MCAGGYGACNGEGCARPCEFVHAACVSTRGMMCACAKCAQGVCVMDAWHVLHPAPYPGMLCIMCTGLGADVAIATSSLGKYCFLIGAIAMARRAPRCHLIPLPPPPLALQTPRPSADPCHGLESTQVQMPITWALPAMQGRGNQPPGPGKNLGEGEVGGGSITSSTRRREGEDEGRRLQQANYREV